MTDLERVREALEFDGYDEGVAMLDAHLKEDAERDERLARRVIEKRALQDELSRESSLLADARLELAELREAVRGAIKELRSYGRDDPNTEIYAEELARSLERQLIEEKP